ncbi:MAG: hypothetical protein RSC49_01115 [Clostridium sp.]
MAQVEVGDFSLTVNVDKTTLEKAKMLNTGMQGLVNDLGVDKCLAILNDIKKHPGMFKKAISLMNDPFTINLIKNLLG